MGGRNRSNFAKTSSIKISSMDSSPYLQSLKLKEMPDFMNKLKSKNDKVKDERVTDVRDFGYNKNVLVGNWFEDQKHTHVRHVNTYCTTYNADYSPPLCYRTEDKENADMKFPTSKIPGKAGSVTKSGVADKTCSKCESSANQGQCMYYTEYTKSYVPHKLTKTDEEIVQDVQKLPASIRGNCFTRQKIPVRQSNIAKA